MPRIATQFHQPFSKPYQVCRNVNSTPSTQALPRAWRNGCQIFSHHLARSRWFRQGVPLRATGLRISSCRATTSLSRRCLALPLAVRDSPSSERKRSRNRELRWSLVIPGLIARFYGTFRRRPHRSRGSGLSQGPSRDESVFPNLRGTKPNAPLILALPQFLFCCFPPALSFFPAKKSPTIKRKAAESSTVSHPSMGNSSGVWDLAL